MDDGRQDTSRIPLSVRIGEPERLVDVAERLCGSGYFVETSRDFAEAERVRLVLTLGAEPHEPIELQGEVLRLRAGAGEPARGVEVWIPPDCEADRARLQRLLQRVGKGGVPATRTCRVLVVEDTALLRRLYAQALERVADSALPVELVTEFVEDGAQAYDRLARRPKIDLVLADLYMPVMDGFELLRRIQAEPGLTGTPVVVLTAGGPDAVAQAHELGAQIVLQKPVRMAAISEAVRQLLQLPDAPAGG